MHERALDRDSRRHSSGSASLSSSSVATVKAADSSRPLGPSRFSKPRQAPPNTHIASTTLPPVSPDQTRQDSRNFTRWSQSTSSSKSYQHSHSSSSQSNSYSSGYRSSGHSHKRSSGPKKSHSVESKGRPPSTSSSRTTGAVAAHAPSPFAQLSGSMYESENTTRTMHERDRSGSGRTGNSSGSTETESGDPSRRKTRKEKDKKTLLSRALQRANDAVVYDNQQDYGSAITAYEEACNLLTSVTSRSASEDDQRKLSAIRDTYIARIQELQQIHDAYPTSEEDVAPGANPQDIRPSLDAHYAGYESPPQIATAVVARPLDGSSYIDQVPATEGQTLELPRSVRPSSAMPAPLSPRHPPPPPPPPTSQHAAGQQLGQIRDSWTEPFHEQPHITGKPSWPERLQEEPHEESTGSPTHSINSLEGFRRKYLGGSNGETEAEFDAALDAAVEAAYMEGYEPYDEADLRSKLRESFKPGVNAFSAPLQPQPQPIASSSQQTPSLQVQEQQSILRPKQTQRELPGIPTAAEQLDYSADESEEEERLLDQVAAEIPFDRAATKFTFPRQSASSAFSSGTHGSSVASSNFTNATGPTSLSTVEENMRPSTSSSYGKGPPLMPPPAPPPRGSLPPPPPLPKDFNPPNIVQQTITAPMSSLPLPPASPSVQERRGSASSKAKLKIETAMPRATSPLAMPSGPPSRDTTTAAGNSLQPNSGVDGNGEQKIPKLQPSPFLGHTSNPSSGLTPSTSGLTPAMSMESVSLRPSPQSNSPASPFKSLPERPNLRKNVSSLSLKQSKSLVDESSPGTPMSFAFATTLAPPGGARVPVNTPASGSFPQRPPPPPTSESQIRLFDSDFHTTGEEAVAINMPRKLEPCPDSALLRPFWLLRCIFQTLTHPRGGYISSKLFIPREIWKVKNVKLKGVEDKIAACDLLTAALRKLATVDTFDAEAVMDEMQTFEAVLDQAQTSLARKLGGDVGPQNASSLFKDAPVTSPGPDGDRNNIGEAISGSTRSSSKNFVSSWRKLRSKTSATNLNTGHPAAPRDTSRDSNTMASVPMTGSANIPKVYSLRRSDGTPDVTPDGPNAAYMAALIRVCDASQVLDQIARQVEDPGLKASSQQYVGLELSVRHAAEFYAFYVCRFVLQDLSILVDKFVKRASEWVLG